MPIFNNPQEELVQIENKIIGILLSFENENPGEWHREIKIYSQSFLKEIDGLLIEEALTNLLKAKKIKRKIEVDATFYKIKQGWLGCLVNVLQTRGLEPRMEFASAPA